MKPSYPDCHGAGFEIVGEASDGHEAVRLARELQPDVAVLDVVASAPSCLFMYSVTASAEVEKELATPAEDSAEGAWHGEDDGR
jgi:DNA-binding NarL/FixJ family response regulator